MLDIKHVTNYKCSINKVVEGNFPDDIQLIVGLEDGDEASITIMSRGLYLDQLHEMAAGTRDHCIWTYGNADIDLYRTQEGYILLHSPHEGLYIRYYLKKGEFEKLFI